MKWADLCPSSVLFLFILSSWGPTVAFTSIFTYTIPANLKLDMSYKQTIRLWGEIETDRKCGDCTIFKYVCVEEREGWQVCPSVRGLGWYQRCWLWRQHLLIKHRNCHHHHYYSFFQPPSLQTWLHIAVCNGLHAKSTSLSSSDSMWFECMELYPVNCAISTGIFADLCLERTAQCLQGSGCQYDYESASYLIYLFFILDYRTAELQ